jgi:hypothetical protein
MGALAPRLYVQDKQPRRHRSESITPGAVHVEDLVMASSHTTIAKQIEGWFHAYAELLDSWRLFHYRAQFDIDRGQLVMIAMSPRRACVEMDGNVSGDMVTGLIERVEWIPRQLELRCMACGTSIGVSGPKMLPDVTTGTSAVCLCGSSPASVSQCVYSRWLLVRNASNAFRAVWYAGCICHLPESQSTNCYTIQFLTVSHSLLSARGTDQSLDTLDESLIFCQTCRHGGHANHILGWFYGASTANGEGRKHETCAVPGCNCRCLDE